jgi:hypothetical protein
MGCEQACGCPLLQGPPTLTTPHSSKSSFIGTQPGALGDILSVVALELQPQVEWL